MSFISKLKIYFHWSYSLSFSALFMDHFDRLDYSPYLSRQVEGVSMLYEVEVKECILVATPTVGNTGSSIFFLAFSCLIFLLFSLLVEHNLQQHQHQNNITNIGIPKDKIAAQAISSMMD